MSRRHRSQSARPIVPPRTTTNHTDWCKHVPVTGWHLLIHAVLGFVEYHTVDLLFHHFTGTNATALMLSALNAMIPG